MRSLNKDLSFMTLYFRHARYAILLFVIYLSASQLIPLHGQLRDMPQQKTGYDYTGKILESTMEYPVKEYDFAPSFNGLLEYCDYTSTLRTYLGITMLCVLLTSYTMGRGAKTKFTLERLALSPKRKYFLQVLCAFLALVTVMILDNIIIALSYAMYLSKVPDALHTYNEFFHYYINSDVMILLFPVFHIRTLLLLILFLVYSAVLSVNGAFYIRNKEYGTGLIHGFSLLLGILMYTSSAHNDRKPFLFAFVVGVFTIVRGIRSRHKCNYSYIPIYRRRNMPKQKSKKEMTANEA